MNRKFKVIVADDEKLIARNIARRIEEGCEAFQVIAQAGTGLEALELAGQLMPDVVFSDIKMPEMDGIELIARLREQNPSALCVIVSGYSDFEYARAAIQNSAVDYLLKPVNPEELSALLKRMETMLMAREQALAPRREASAGEVVENVMLYRGRGPGRVRALSEQAVPRPRGHQPQPVPDRPAHAEGQEAAAGLPAVHQGDRRPGGLPGPVSFQQELQERRGHEPRPVPGPAGRRR